MNMNNTEQTSVNPYDQLLKLKYPESYEIQNDQTEILSHTQATTITHTVLPMTLRINNIIIIFHQDNLVFDNFLNYNLSLP